MDDLRVSNALRKLTLHRRDEDAWEELYRQIYPFMIATLYRDFHGVRYLADEAAQEVMMRLLRNLNFKRENMTPASLLDYVKQTIHSVVADFFRRDRVLKDRVPEIVNSDGEAPRLIDRNLETGQGLIGSFALEQAVARLPLKDRQIVILLQNGKSIADIAKRLNVTEKTTYNRVSNIRKELRKALFQ